MKVTVHLHTILQIETPEGLVRRLDLELLEGSTLQDILDKLQLTIKPDDVLLVVNHLTAPPEQVLHDGDEINLIPALSGGSKE